MQYVVRLCDLNGLWNFSKLDTKWEIKILEGTHKLTLFLYICALEVTFMV